MPQTIYTARDSLTLHFFDSSSLRLMLAPSSALVYVDTYIWIYFVFNFSDAL